MRTYVLERRFRPGEAVPESGIYRVRHKRHRAAHESTLSAGETFPLCRRCGVAVTYELVAPVKGSLGGTHRPAASLLVVDDERAVAFTLKRVLEREGYDVATANTYRDAVASLKQREFDAVITEMDLERSAEGLELVRMLRRRNPAPIVILSTAEPSVQKLKGALGLRVNYLVVKPIDIAELSSVLSRTIARRLAEREVFA